MVVEKKKISVAYIFSRHCAVWAVAVSRRRHISHPAVSALIKYISIGYGTLIGSGRMMLFFSVCVVFLSSRFWLVMFFYWCVAILCCISGIRVKTKVRFWNFTPPCFLCLIVLWFRALVSAPYCARFYVWFYPPTFSNSSWDKTPWGSW